MSSAGDRPLHAEDGLTKKDRLRGLASLVAIIHVGPEIFQWSCWKDQGNRTHCSHGTELLSCAGGLERFPNWCIREARVERRDRGPQAAPLLRGLG